MSRRRARLVAVLLALGLAALASGLVPSASALEVTGSLNVTPGLYVGGQKLTFEGKLGNSRRSIHLQFHMNRPGDRWTDIDRFHGSTDDDGHFEFTYPAPAMFGISLRVAGEGLATPRWTFSAQSQEVLVTVRANDLDLGDGVVVAGRPFTVRVDTAPNAERRADLPPPVFPGRTVTLQRRVRGHEWKSLDTAVTDAEGRAKFEVTVEEPGQEVYRVRQEDWFEKGNQIGWFPSFPVEVQVLSGLPRTTAASRPASVTQTEESAGWWPVAAKVGPQTTASQSYGWAPAQWDFGWEYGESLTSLPHKALVMKGRWVDASDGSGRAVHYNGGLLLDSRWGSNTGPGDVGDTWVTLRGNPMAHGRWEVRLRPWATETSAADYTIRAELIPDDPDDYACGARTITMVEVDVHQDEAHYGVRARDGREWVGTQSGLAINQTPHAFGVQVTKRHITWFVDGRPVGTVRDDAAISGVPLTMRLTLDGDGRKEMNRTRAIWDWQRGFTLDRGDIPTSDRRLDRGRHDITC